MYSPHFNILAFSIAFIYVLNELLVVLFSVLLKKNSNMFIINLFISVLIIVILETYSISVSSQASFF